MRDPLIKVMAITSIILGLYIIFIYFFNPLGRVDYHLGCYLSNLNLDKSFKLKQQLNSINRRSIANHNYLNKVKSSSLIDTDLHKKSVELSKNVQKYIQKLVQSRQIQKSNINFYTDLSKARQNYEQCALRIQQSFNTQDCLSLWNTYQQCFIDFEKQRFQLRSLYGKRDILTRQIQLIIKFDPNNNKSINIEAQLKLIKQKYQRSNSQNDKNKDRFISQLKRVQHKHQTKLIQQEQIQRELNRTKLEYQICLRNLKQFKKCQNIAKAIKQYGHAQSIQSLQNRITAKRENLMKMRELVIESQNSYGDSQQIKIMYQKRQAQLKQLLKLRLDMSYDQMKQCGCKQQDKIRLKNQYESSKFRTNALSKQINELSSKMKQIEYQIKDTEKLRERLLNEYKQQTQNLINRDHSNPDLKTKVKQIKHQLQQLDNKIKGYNRKFNSLQFQCNQYKDNLMKKVHSINEITDCVGKKDYYQKLRQRSNEILHKDSLFQESNELNYKQNIINSLSNINIKQNMIVYDEVRSIMIEQTLSVIQQILINTVIKKKPVQMNNSQHVQVSATENEKIQNNGQKNQENQQEQQQQGQQFQEEQKQGQQQQEQDQQNGQGQQQQEQQYQDQQQVGQQFQEEQKQGQQQQEQDQQNGQGQQQQEQQYQDQQQVGQQFQEEQKQGQQQQEQDQQNGQGQQQQEQQYQDQQQVGQQFQEEQKQGQQQQEQDQQNGQGQQQQEQQYQDQQQVGQQFQEEQKQGQQQQEQDQQNGQGQQQQEQQYQDQQQVGQQFQEEQKQGQQQQEQDQQNGQGQQQQEQQYQDQQQVGQQFQEEQKQGQQQQEQDQQNGQGQQQQEQQYQDQQQVGQQYQQQNQQQEEIAQENDEQIIQKQQVLVNEKK